MGEKGPEFFIPGASGSIGTNDIYRRMTGAGSAGALGALADRMKPVSWPSAEKTAGAVVAAKADSGRRAEPARRGDITITNQWTINGADDPRKVAATVDSRFRQLAAQLEAEQRTYLSD